LSSTVEAFSKCSAIIGLYSLTYSIKLPLPTPSAFLLAESIHSIDLKRSERKTTLEKLAGEFFSKKLRIDVAIRPSEASDSPSDSPSDSIEPTESIDEAEAQDELVEQALELFGGRIIVKRKKLRSKMT